MNQFVLPSIVVTPNNSSQNAEKGCLLSPMSAINVSPATPIPTPMPSPEGVNVLPVIKRDLVVRFTDKQNSVRCEMANKNGQNGNNSDTNHSVMPTTATPSVKYRDQYEVQHYSRHPHGPMSPCDSENSVCNRSRENLISTQGKMIKKTKIC